MSRIAYFEIHATSPDRLIIFYSELFGWRFEKSDDPREYWMIITGPDNQTGINGGLTPRPGGSPLNTQAFNSFVCIIEVSALEKALVRLVDLGGKVVEQQMPIPGIGRLAYGQDPDGNVFGMMQSAP